MSDTSDGLQALATIAQYPLKIDSAGAKAAGTATGPWKLYVYCTYGACDANWKKYWWDVNFSGSRGYLQSVCDAAEQHAKTFLRSFQPINLWMKTTLPDVSRQFATNTDAILKTLNEVQGNNPTPQQRQEVSRLLQQSQRLAPAPSLWRAARGFPADIMGWPSSGAGLKSAFVLPILLLSLITRLKNLSHIQRQKNA